MSAFVWANSDGIVTTRSVGPDSSRVHARASARKSAGRSIGRRRGTPYGRRRGMGRADGLVTYLNDAWTPYHAVFATCEALRARGYEELDERDAWSLRRGGKYFYTRNASACVAFAVGGGYEAGDGFVIVGAHTDSPCPKLKPNTRVDGGGDVRIRVQPYGGGLWHTWFDRDLGIAGRVVVKSSKTNEVFHRLVKIDRAVCRIPTLAIHLDRGVNSEGMKVNFQQHMAPILATRSKAEGGEETKEKKTEDDRGEESSRHHPLLLKLIADEIGCAPGDIVDFDLQLCDTQPSAIGGAQREFVYSGRLDNLVSCYTSLHALLNASTDEALEKASGVRMIMHFDHEEVGSESSSGAAGAMTTDAIKRIAAALNPEAVEGLDERTRRASFCVSSDMAHALHPNYADRHEPAHAPKMHGGLVIKHNANQRYATDAVTAFMFRELGERAGVPVQEFVVRSDTGCGSTIGPIFSTRTGIRTVDVGAAQLSMHSIREVCGADDIDHAVTHLTALFLHFIDLDRTLIVDGAIGALCRRCDVFESTSQMSLDASVPDADDARTYAT